MLPALISLAACGLAQALISPPYNLVVLHPLCWVPAFAVLQRLRGRTALAAGWLVGISANLAIFYWLPGTVVRFGGLPLPVALALWLLYAATFGFYAAVFGWGFARVRQAAGLWWPPAVAAWFCALEFLNPQLFGYLQGDAWYQVPRVFLVSAATGVSGVSFLVLLCNAVVLQGLELSAAGRRALAWCAGGAHPPRRPQTRAPAGSGAATRRAWLVNAAVLGMLCLGAAEYSTFRMEKIAAAERAADPLLVALVQPDHTIERRDRLETGRPDAFAADLLALSRQAQAGVGAGRKIDVFVWPEGALRVDPGQARNRAVRDFVRSTGAEVWTGANHYQTDARHRVVVYNSAFRIFDQGSIDRRYDKNVLVPFGEYVPLAGMIPGLDRIPTAGDFEAGTGVPRYTRGRTRFVFLICYEAIRSAFVREAIGDDVNLLVNLTIDAWYGMTSEQSQHLMLAAAQSAMNGLPLVRATSTGISAFVDARGILTAQTGRFTRETLVGEVRPVRVAGPYSRWGPWFAWLCVAVSAALLAMSRRLQRIS